MEDKKIKKRWLIVFSVILILILVGIFAIYLPWKHKAKAPITSSNTNTTSEGGVIESANSNTNAKPDDTLTANDYYQQSLKEFTDKNYDLVVSDLAKAIELDPSNIDYYKIKSAAENNLGKKEDAINTVKAGLKISPNDQLLINRLDSLQKEYYNTQTNDGRN